MKLGTSISLALAAMTFLMSGAVLAADASKEKQPAKKVGTAPSTKPGAVFQECRDCPKMVVIPAGHFVMGSDYKDPTNYNFEESPQRPVEITRPFAAGLYNVTRGEYAKFIKESGYQVKPGCGVFQMPFVEGQMKFHFDLKGGWDNPNFKQTDTDPVVCVSWDEANAYVDWLNAQVAKNAKKTGEKSPGPYRLLSESEWEYAARARTTTRYFWGDNRADACKYANAADLSGKRASPDWVVPDCDDGYATTSPSGKFLPNAFGLYDMAGNAWQWVQDCWIDNYAGAPSDGSARVTPGCPAHVARGGSWRYDPSRGLRSASRGNDEADAHFASLGFRVGRTLN